MDMGLLGGLIDAGSQLVGGGLNAMAGYQGASSQRDAARKMRQMLQQAITEGKGYIGSESRAEQEQMLIQINRAERMGRKSLALAEQRADAELYNTFASPMYQQAAGYMQSMFQEGIPAPLAQDLAGRIRSAQTARGLQSGGAAIQNESRVLSSMAAQQRQALLPQMRQMAMDPMEQRRQEVGSRLQQQGAAQGIGLAQLQSQTQGYQAAEGMAASRYGTYTSLLGSLTGQMPYSAASPQANALLASGQTVQNVGSSLSGMLGGLEARQE